MNTKVHFFTPFLLLFCLSLSAEPSSIYQVSVNKPIEKVYEKMLASFDDSPFFVVKELNIGKNLLNFAEKWGDDYNRNKLTAIRSLVLCNGWYANQVSNKDPAMLALCPLRVSLIEKEGKTTALFARPTVMAKGSPAYELFVEIEQKIIQIINKGMESI